MLDFPVAYRMHVHILIISFQSHQHKVKCLDSVSQVLTQLYLQPQVCITRQATSFDLASVLNTAQLK